MFGYFNFNERYATFEMQNVYKNYYCGTCFSLQYHYGQLARLLLSYDITLFAVILKLHHTPHCDRLKCYGQAKCKKQLFSDEEWKKIAALNLLLSAEKLRDDIEDNKSIKAMIAKIFYGNVFKKARNDFPNIAECIADGYQKILDNEKRNASLLELAHYFAEMMLNTAKAAFEIDNTQQTYIYEISRWLYVIDAFDDYEKDVKKGDFNPLAQEGVSYTSFVNNNCSNIQKLINDLSKNYRLLLNKYDNECVEEQIMCSILRDTIPINTSLILNETQQKVRLRKYGSVWRRVI